MKVARLHGRLDLRVHTEPKPIPADGEVLVDIRAVGICGSDIHWYEEGAMGDHYVTQPLVLGHEFAGVVASGPRHGQRVACDPAIPCGTCARCREGDPHLCPSVKHAAHAPVDGAFAEFAAWPLAQLHPIPDTLTDADGALLEPLGIALHALDLAPLRPTSRVAVLGCGPIGLLITRLAALSGATRIVATDRLPHRLAAAREMGATATIDVTGERVGPAVHDLAGGGADVAYEVAGDNDAIEDAFDAARPGGAVVIVGVPREDRISVLASVARFKELRVVFSQRMKHTYDRAIELAEGGRIALGPLVTHRFPLEQAPEALEFARGRGGIKVVIEP